MPQAAALSTIRKTAVVVMLPENGQPKAVAKSTRNVTDGSDRYDWQMRCNSFNDSCGDCLTLQQLCLRLTEKKKMSFLMPQVIASSAPRSLGISAERITPRNDLTPLATSLISLNCAMACGATKEPI